MPQVYSKLVHGILPVLILSVVILVTVLACTTWIDLLPLDDHGEVDAPIPPLAVQPILPNPQKRIESAVLENTDPPAGGIIIER
jgi:hypothetical protein